MKNVLFFFLSGTFCFVTTLMAAQTVYKDKVYEENIQSVRIYPKTAEFSSQLDAAVVALNPSTSLVLEFDDIAFDADRYSATLIHCNSDWTPSGLKAADYLTQYNEFNIDNYEYSIDTRIPYIHFTFQIPPVTKSGNYVIKVYRGRQEDEVILTKRFMVYDNQLQVGAAVVPTSKTADRMSSQDRKSV